MNNKVNKEIMFNLCQGQLEAYNKKDIETFVSFYHTNIKVYKIHTNNKTELLFEGILEFKNQYQKRFQENPQLHCHLKSRILLQSTVIDEEHITGLSFNSTISNQNNQANQTNNRHVAAIYKFSDLKISEVYFVD